MCNLKQPMMSKDVCPLISCSLAIYIGVLSYPCVCLDSGLELAYSFIKVKKQYDYVDGNL
jgi:hypothetical protein